MGGQSGWHFFPRKKIALLIHPGGSEFYWAEVDIHRKQCLIPSLVWKRWDWPDLDNEKILSITFIKYCQGKTL